MMLSENGEVSPREHLEHEWYAEEGRLTREHAVRMKQLELAEQKLEAQWSSWLRIPITVIKWPVYVFISIGCMIAVALGKEVPENIINLIK